VAFGGFKRISFRRKGRVQPDGVFMKCEGCGAMIVIKETEERGGVCRECNYHFRIGARRRVDLTLDPGSFREMFAEVRSADPLRFEGKQPYEGRLEKHREASGTDEGILVGLGELMGRPIAFGVTEFFFMSGSMGSAVGERLTRITEEATRRGLPLVVFSGSGGGARMDEGMHSLMQMAKTSAALGRHRLARLPYVVVVTNSSYGGTMASWASLGDVIIAEPRAMMGFTGPRVIRETLKVELPPGFQEAEFMLRHGLIDLIVPRMKMRETLNRIIGYLGPAEQAGDERQDVEAVPAPAAQEQAGSAPEDPVSSEEPQPPPADQA
jgi:acetyl-CoA carboxylase carboxyl transferase subunit beta